jgi:hypothetical protein
MKILPLLVAGLLIDMSAGAALAQPPVKKHGAASAKPGAQSYASGHRIRQKESLVARASASSYVPRRNETAAHRMQSTTGLGMLIAPRLKIVPGD